MFKPLLVPETIELMKINLLLVEMQQLKKWYRQLSKFIKDNIMNMVVFVSFGTNNSENFIEKVVWWH